MEDGAIILMFPLPAPKKAWSAVPFGGGEMGAPGGGMTPL